MVGPRLTIEVRVAGRCGKKEEGGVGSGGWWWVVVVVVVMEITIDLSRRSCCVGMLIIISIRHSVHFCPLASETSVATKVYAVGDHHGSR